jgi:hypothetical protein
VHERVVHDGGGGGEPACMRIARVGAWRASNRRSSGPSRHGGGVVFSIDQGEVISTDAAALWWPSTQSQRQPKAVAKPEKRLKSQFPTRVYGCDTTKLIKTRNIKNLLCRAN